MPSPRAANCIFCDDIRVEVGNKISLMGVYDSDILIPLHPPVTIARFCIIVWIISDIDDRPSSITVRVLSPPERTEVLTMTADTGEAKYLYDPDELSRGILRVLGVVSPMVFNHEGFIEVMVDTERETFRAGRLRIRFDAPAAEMDVPPTG